MRKIPLNKREPVVSKGLFIRRFGRSNWNAIPKQHIWKDGKRRYVSLEWAIEFANSYWEKIGSAISVELQLYANREGFMRRYLGKTDAEI